MTALAVWLDGTLIGSLERRSKVLRFTYSTSAFALGVGRPLVSVTMPVRRAAYTGDVVDSFFDGLLPEGEALRMIAYDFKLDTGDAYGLLAQLGRDCAGAMQIIAGSDAPAPPAGVLELIDDAQVAERLRKLKTFPLGVDKRVRISLAGVQEKMVLTRTTDGWALPLDGAPSTHIFKPAHPFLAHAVVNEAFCLAVARNAGVRTTDAEVLRFAGRDVLVVSRFDRTHAGPVHRIHQEDMCQATATSPRLKYEADGGPSLAACAAVLRTWSDGPDSLDRLIDITTMNVALGNADAHGKNLSLLHTREGGIELAPAYDLLCTRYYEQPETIAGMFVNGIRDIDEVTTADLIAEATSWGMPAQHAADRIGALLAEMPAAIHAAAAQVAAPDDLVELVSSRVARLTD